MSRTHFVEDSAGSAVDVTSGTNTRLGYTGAFVGNYVTIRLTVRAAVASGQATDLLVDRFPLPMPFRVSQVCFDALGTTAAANLKIVQTALDGSTSTNICAATVVSSGTPKIITPGNLVNTSAGLGKGNTPRDIARGCTLDLMATTDGTGAIPQAGASAWVTGYFTRHAADDARFAIRGQSRSESPVAGFYDVWPLLSQRANANQAQRAECSILAPYAARVMGIYFDGRNLTTTTGTITADIFNGAGTILSAALDADATLANNSVWLDATTTPGFASSAARDVAKGDTIKLMLSSGAADVVPIGGIEATLFVWCKGHVRDINTEPTVED